MATVFYVNNGPYPNFHQDQVRVIDLIRISEKFSNIRTKYTKNHPVINIELEPEFLEYVVVQVGEDEAIPPKFGKPGFYTLLGVSPEEAEPLLFPNPA